MTQGYLLDTNIPSELSRPVPDVRLRTWVASKRALYLSAISIGEFRRGCYLLPQGRRRTEIEFWLEEYLLQWRKDRVLPVTEQIAARWGELSAMRQQLGRPLLMPDGLIAATAIEHDLILVTRNVKDFTGLNLTLVDPWQSETAPKEAETREEHEKP